MGKRHWTWISAPGVNWWKTDGPRDLGYAQYCFPLLQFCQKLFRNGPTISPFPLPRMLGRVSRKDTKLENYPLTFTFKPWEHSQPSWNITLPEGGPSSLLLRRPCWGQPAAFFHTPHSAPCPLPRHSLPGETSPHPSLAPLPNPCNYQTPT